MPRRKIIHLLFLFAYIMHNPASAQTSKPASVNVTQLINSISDSLTRHYIFPDKAAAISAFLRVQTKKNVYAALQNNPVKLAEQIGHDMSVAYHDPHMRITFDPGFVPQETFKPDAQEVQRIKKYWQENNYMFKKAEILPGNIGYLPFDLFTDDIESAKPIVAAALTFLKNTNALIIDLKNNMGGSPQMVSQLESYFFKEKTHMNDLINRTNLDTTFLYADPAKADSFCLSMPVYILTGPNTFSGAEDFSYGMQVAKRAEVIGEITGGGAHPQTPFSVGQQFVVFIPFARSVNPITQTDWEGTGVIPDVKATAKEALVKAQDVIFRKLMEQATDEKEKSRYQYYFNALLLKETNKKPSSRELLPLTGTYGGLVIYAANGKLYCKNMNSGGTISPLQYLSSNLFVLDKDAQINFVKDNKGKYNNIKILVNDGSVFDEKRSKNE